MTARGDVLNVTPRDVLDDALRADIRASKRELLALLAASAAPEIEPRVLERSRELGAILEAFPGARLLKSGAWRIVGQRIEHAQALKMARGEGLQVLAAHEAAAVLRAHVRGTTSHGWPLCVDVGDLWREHNPSAPEAASEEVPQVLAGGPAS